MDRPPPTLARPAPPRTRAVRRQIAEWRRSRSPGWGAALAAHAVTLVAGVVIWGAMLVSLALRVHLPVFPCEAGTCSGLVPVIGPVSAVLVLLTTLLVALVVGPLGVPPWEAFWLLSSPLDRRELLRPAFTRALFAGLGGGLVAGLGLFALVPLDPRWILFLVAAGGAGIVGAVGIQAFGGLTRFRLARAGSLHLALAGAAVSSDAALGGDILLDRAAERQGHVRPRPGRGSGWWALVWRDAYRVPRQPRSALLGLAALAVAFVVAPAGPGLQVLAGGSVLLLALQAGLGSVRLTMRTAGLARCFPLSDRAQRGAHTIVPALLAGLWATALALVLVASGSPFVDAAVGASLTAGAALTAGVRFATQGALNQTFVVSELGPIPVGLLQRMLRGPDALVLAGLAVGLGVPAGPVGLALAGAIGSAVLVSSRG